MGSLLCLMVGELSAGVTRVTGPRGMSSSRELAQTFHMSVAKFEREREREREKTCEAS